MTKHLKSGETSKHHSSRNIDDHVKSRIVSTDGQFEGNEVEVQSDPLIDKESGRPIVLRTFEFKKSADFDKLNPTKQELFNAHEKQLRIFLWKDGLEPVESMPPRIVHKDDTYIIFVTCQAKQGVVIVENPLNLSAITNAHGHTQ